MDNKAELMACLSSNDIHQFEALLSRIVSKTDEFSYIEVADLMSLAEHESFCFKLFSYVDYFIKQLHYLQQQSQLSSNKMEVKNDNSSDENIKSNDSNANSGNKDAPKAILNEDKVVKCLLKASEIIYLYTNANMLKYRPPSLLTAIQLLHNLLILLDDKVITGVVNLKNSIAKICEYWWNHQENNAEQYITQLIPYLLLSALRVGAHETDIKRLYKMQTALLLLDFDDDSIESIRNMLLRCAAHPLFLKSNDGNKFLSFVFTIHLGLPPLILDVMRAQLMDPHGSSSGSSTGSVKLAAVFGRILYHAWKKYAHIIDSNNNNTSGSGDTQQQQAIMNEQWQQQQQLIVERDSIQECLQTLVHEAIHTTDPKYFRSLRVLLTAFHDAKRYKGVDTMLLKVYGPILWRSLKCANAVVRVQATMIFFDSFPLQDEHASAAEADSILQKQFDLFSSMLKDSDHRVRAAVASGVCHVLQEFWSALPYATTKQTLAYIVGTLGRDAACANVRVAVMTGLHSLLDQPLAHSVLKNLLPILSTAIHDHSERVRLAFINILIKVKLIRGITFYNIVAVDHLLLRLEDDFKRPQVCIRMTELLLNSFFPFDVPNPAAAGGGKDEEEKDEEVVAVRVDKERCRRCVEFLHKSPYAAMAFYTHLHTQVSMIHLTRFAMSLFQLFIAIEHNTKDHDDDDGYEVEDRVTTNTGKHKNRHRQQQTKNNKRKTANHTTTTTATTAPSQSSSLSMLLLLESSETYIHILRVIHILLTSLQKQQQQLSQSHKKALVGKDNDGDAQEIKKALLLIFSRHQLNQTLTTIHSLTRSSSGMSPNPTYPQLVPYIAEINNCFLEIFTIIQTYTAAVGTSADMNEEGHDDDDDDDGDNHLLSTQYIIQNFDQLVIDNNQKSNHNNNNGSMSNTPATVAAESTPLSSSASASLQQVEMQARVVVETAVALGEKEKLYTIISSAFDYHAAALTAASSSSSNMKSSSKKRKNQNVLLHPSSTATSATITNHSSSSSGSGSVVSLAAGVELLSACCLTMSPTEQFIESLTLLQATFQSAVTLVTAWLTLQHKVDNTVGNSSYNGECQLPVMAQLFRLWLVTVMQLHQLGISPTVRSASSTVNVLSVEYMTQWLSSNIIFTLCQHKYTSVQTSSNRSVECNETAVDIVNSEAESVLCNVMLNVYSDMIQLVLLSADSSSIPSQKQQLPLNESVCRAQHDVWLSPLLKWITQLDIAIMATNTTTVSSIRHHPPPLSLLSVGLCRLAYVFAPSLAIRKADSSTTGAVYALLTQAECSAITGSLIHLLLVPFTPPADTGNENNASVDSMLTLIVKTLSYILLSPCSSEGGDDKSNKAVVSEGESAVVEDRLVSCLIDDYLAFVLHHNHKKKQSEKKDHHNERVMTNTRVTSAAAAATEVAAEQQTRKDEGDQVTGDGVTNMFFSQNNTSSSLAARLVGVLMMHFTAQQSVAPVPVQGRGTGTNSLRTSATAEIAGKRLLCLTDSLSQKLCDRIKVITAVTPAEGDCMVEGALEDGSSSSSGEEPRTFQTCECMAALLRHIIITCTIPSITTENGHNNNSSSVHGLLKQVLVKTNQNIVTMMLSAGIEGKPQNQQQLSQPFKHLGPKLLEILSSSSSSSTVTSS